MNMKTTLRRRFGRQLGVSLIEALVALAVMAIGMLGIVGVQATLRTNSDVAKQRSEALRLAQREVEKWRSFVVVGATGATPPGYADMVTGTYSETGVSATFNVSRTVTDLPDPRQGKALKVQVGWTDRTNNASQQVQLSTMVARIAPEFGATMVVGGDGDAVGQQPRGRNRGIPITAKDFGNGTSGFLPPGSEGAGVAWRFDNTTGLITLCSVDVTVTTTADLTTANITCGANAALLLAGYVHYSIGLAAVVLPSATNFDTLPAEATTLSVFVRQTAPMSIAGNLTCFTSTYDAVTRAYYCAVPVLLLTGTTPNWSGDLRFDYPTLDPDIVNSYTTDDDERGRKVCRFHTNAAYTSETKSRLNQNYLVIRAGDNTVAYTCPSPTIRHQP
jgi:hypothetical protein